MAFSKHVTQYNPQPGFPYYNLTSHTERAHPIHHIGTHWAALEASSVPSKNQSICLSSRHIEYYTITALERDQYEVLWSRVQQYWTRQNYCTLLHKTSYWSISSVVIVLLHKILENFRNFEKKNWKFWNFMKFLKFFEILENFDFFLKNLTFFLYIVRVLLNERVTVISFIDFAIWFFIAQKLLFANQYVRKWNVPCIASGQ